MERGPRWTGSIPWHIAPRGRRLGWSEVCVLVPSVSMSVSRWVCGHLPAKYTRYHQYGRPGAREVTQV